MMKAAVPAESYILFIILHRHVYSPAMSTGSSQVGAALFPSFQHIFYHFTFPGFPFILKISMTEILNSKDNEHYPTKVINIRNTFIGEKL